MWPEKREAIKIVAYLIAIVIVIIIVWWSIYHGKSKLAPGKSYIDPDGYARKSKEVGESIGKKGSKMSDIHASKKSIEAAKINKITNKKVRNLLSTDAGQIAVSNGGSVDDLSLDTQADLERQIWDANIASGDPSYVTPYSGAMHSMDIDRPMMDYDRYITDNISDSRMLENQSRYNIEMSDISGAHRFYDNMDEALESSIPYLVYRPSAVAQRSNAMFVTELDASNLIGNDKYGYNRMRNNQSSWDYSSQDQSIW